MKSLLILFSTITTYLIIAMTSSVALAQPQNTYVRYNCGPARDIGLSIPKCVREEPSDNPAKPSSVNNPIIAWLVFFVNLLSVVIVLGGSVMLAVAGVQYTASRDNAQAVQAAKQRIFNVIIGLLMYVFFYSFMQWLVPGGVF